MRNLIGKLITSFVVLSTISSVTAWASNYILAQETKAFQGNIRKVCGIVDNVVTDRSNYLLNFRTGKEPSFSALIRENQIPYVGGANFIEDLKGKEVCVMGLINAYADGSQISIVDKSQLEVPR